MLVMIWAFAAFGLLCIVLALVKMARMFGIQTYGCRVMGRCVRIEPGSEGSGTPVVEYRIGEQIHETHGWGSIFSYRVGDPVAVYYYPGESSRARIVAPAEWIAAWFFLGFGILFSSIACVLGAFQ